MTREVYARFSDIDEAETAVRALRRHCGGIHAVKIKRRSHPKSGFPDMIPATAFAMWSTSSDITADRPAAPAAVIPMGFWDSAPGTETHDGPAARTDCLLEVVVDREYAPKAEALLRAEHGYEVFQTGADMVH